ncbi:biopolymer transporter ExbD [Permianibacter sp. IMCC34836]|uniref:ExbD/TolR family protein n=1 Tax=Permianibacter fluminis TaxID=2738515 RepID=UPI0015577CF8|nr:biopolymer transporter ExbD [Permianibacter fluminis]NQD38334.1 biopolymer transporter ExbD [Permianibacter fluminis]
MKASHRSKRMQRHHKRFKQGSLSLTSMMDVFTILVFFLLVNQGIEQQLPATDSIKLPQSLSEKLPPDALVVMVSKDDIIVQGRAIMKAGAAEKSEDDLLPALKTELMLQQQNRMVAAGADEKNPALIMGDKEIPYRLLKKIMYTLADAQYTDISLAVLKKD